MNRDSKEVNKDDVLAEINKIVAEKVEKAKVLMIEELETFLHEKMQEKVLQEIDNLLHSKRDDLIINEIMEEYNNKDNLIIKSEVGTGKSFILKTMLDNLPQIDINRIDEYVVKSKIKKFLDKRKLSQAWLREKTNISRSTLSYILNNPDTVSLKNAFKIAKALGVSIEEIFDFKL